MASNLDTIQHGSFHVRTHSGRNKERVSGRWVGFALLLRTHQVNFPFSPPSQNDEFRA